MYENLYQETLEPRRHMQTLLPEHMRKNIPAQPLRKKRKPAWVRAARNEFGTPITFPLHLIVFAGLSSLPSFILCPFVGIAVNIIYEIIGPKYYRYPPPSPPINDYWTAFFVTIAIIMGLFTIIFIHGFFLRVREYEKLDDDEDCASLRSECAAEVEAAKAYADAQVTAHQQQIRMEDSRRFDAEYAARRRAEALATRQARVTHLADSVFAAWRRFKAEVDFDGSTPDARLLPLFWQRLPALPVMREPDVGLLRESPNPYLKTILGDFWNRLPAPPNLIA